jgi:hypothetical protein
MKNNDIAEIEIPVTEKSINQNGVKSIDLHKGSFTTGGV